jgi:hypothetical protein
MMEIVVILYEDENSKEFMDHLYKTSIEHHDFNSYLERQGYAHWSSWAEDEDEPVLMVDSMKEELWEEIRDKYTLEELEARLR